MGLKLSKDNRLDLTQKSSNNQGVNAVTVTVENGSSTSDRKESDSNKENVENNTNEGVKRSRRHSDGYDCPLTN